MKVPKNQNARRRLWLNDNPCVQVRAEHRNHVCRSVNGKRRDERLNGDGFYSLMKPRIVTEQWRRHYSTIR